jgi:hypothetical protein
MKKSTLDVYLGLVFKKLIDLWKLVGTRDARTQSARAQPARARAQSVPSPPVPKPYHRLTPITCCFTGFSLPHPPKPPSQTDKLTDKLTELIYMMG